ESRVCARPPGRRPPPRRRGRAPRGRRPGLMAAMHRRVTAEEARDGRLLVEKRWLGRLPAPGEAFTLDDRGVRRTVAIEAEHCECRGPEKPHDHYYLPVAGLERGTTVTLEPG